MVRQAFELKIENPPLYSTKDRRAYGDRRRTCQRDYFLKGGKERRNWKERRFLWYMTR
jgi:hypothetical protein